MTKLLAWTVGTTAPLIAGLAWGQVSPPPVGSVSNDIEFALFEAGGSLADRSLSDLDGKIVALVYYIPG